MRSILKQFHKLAITTTLRAEESIIAQFIGYYLGYVA
ncbi:hypothetical protein KPC_3271 [Acinetobacter stercoris]|uniref:Uncharacterized protein n=1 Tax=Acinetobacter stercoris TaxID=2126983 RepID=A0A2U3N381_9GAMM|nr:hypothetical protein KPC_3271 [Acinetobacter stercoris]